MRTQRHEMAALKSEKLRRHLIQPRTDENSSNHLFDSIVARCLHVTVATFPIPPVAGKTRGVEIPVALLSPFEQRIYA